MKKKRVDEKPAGPNMRMAGSMADKQAVEQLKTSVRHILTNGIGLKIGARHRESVRQDATFDEIGIVTSAPVSRRYLMRYAAREPARCWE
ncbi:hypothetical protein [Mesorhizobium sp. M0228]|uniref:hypothetical protein n=2 Tax=Mesorhizobium TaxID=68287 RepID=UPI00333E0BFB